jgi:F-type H+-transporting ATPase subunit b
MHLLLFAESIQLFPDGTLFVHIAMILAMIWLLNRTLYRPINRVLEAREKSKGGNASEAEGILKDVEGKETRYTRELLDARSEGYAYIEKEQQEAAGAREAQLGEVKAEVAEKFSAGKAELEKQVAIARASIGTDADKMADQIAAQILKS